MFGSITLIPQFVQAPRASGYGFGLSASAAGLLMVPMAALMLLAGLAAPRIARRAGSRVPFQAGTVCAVAAFALLAWAHGAVGAQAVTAILAARTAPAAKLPPESGCTGAFAVLAVIAVAALGVAAAIPRGPGGARDPREEGGVDSGNVQVRALE